MQDIRGKYVPPAIDQLSFSCPHCGAFAKQFWFSLHADFLKKDNTPFRLDDAGFMALTFDDIEDSDERDKRMRQGERLASGRPFIQSQRWNADYALENVSLSRCYSCNDVALWIYNRLIWPMRGEAPLPSSDVPDNVRRDYEEADAILDLSPRGAAALLRLATQELCVHLGEKGKNLDDDIAALVKKDLDRRVQQALDVVRVIGNNAIHPGQLDLRDDRQTAEKLFGLVNLIAEFMISQPKHVSEMFGSLPEGALHAIEKRDGAKSESS